MKLEVNFNQTKKRKLEVDWKQTGSSYTNTETKLLFPELNLKLVFGLRFG